MTARGQGVRWRSLNVAYRKNRGIHWRWTGREAATLLGVYNTVFRQWPHFPKNEYTPKFPYAGGLSAYLLGRKCRAVAAESRGHGSRTVPSPPAVGADAVIWPAPEFSSIGGPVPPFPARV